MKPGNRVKNLVALIQEVMKDRGSIPISILETGTIRKVEYEDGDGHSTRFIAEILRPTDLFISVDLKTDVCDRYLTKLNLINRVTLMQMDSIDFIKMDTHWYDVVYLDSENDAIQIFEEFFQIWPRVYPGGWVVVDDAYPESKTIVKCHRILEYCKLRKIPYEIREHQMYIQKQKR